MSTRYDTARCRVDKSNVPTYDIKFGLLQASCLFFCPSNSKRRSQNKNTFTMTATSSLPFPPPLSSTIRNPKPPPIAAPTGHIAFIHRRGSSLFQRFAVKKPQHKHQPTDTKSPVHAPSPPALCNKHTAPVGSCAAPTADLGSRGGGGWLTMQIFHH